MKQYIFVGTYHQNERQAFRLLCERVFRASQCAATGHRRSNDGYCARLVI